MQQMRIEILRRHYISCNKNLRKNEMIRRKKEKENGKIRHTDLSAFQQFIGYPKKRNLNTGHIAVRTGRSGIQYQNRKNNDGLSDSGGHRHFYLLFLPVVVRKLAVVYQLAIGIFILACSILTRGQVGMGDGWLLMALGCMMRMESYIQMACIGMLLAAACSGVLLLVFRKSRKAEIPLVPFLLLGYVGGMVI